MKNRSINWPIVIVASWIGLSLSLFLGSTEVVGGTVDNLFIIVILLVISLITILIAFYSHNQGTKSIINSQATVLEHQELIQKQLSKLILHNERAADLGYTNRLNISEAIDETRADVLEIKKQLFAQCKPEWKRTHEEK